MALLGGKRPGEWIGAREFCQQISVAADDLTPELFAAWLPDPKAHDGYVVILFYDDESKWSMAALYHRARLVGGALPEQAAQPTGAAVPVSSGSTSGQPSPTVE